MRLVVSLVIAFACFAGAMGGNQPAPSFHSTDTTVLMMGDKVAGRIGACMVGQNKKAKICFGLTKELDGDPEFTFVVLFKTGKKDSEPSGGEGNVKSDGIVTMFKEVYDLGDFELPLTIESKRDQKTGKVSLTKLVVGTIEVTSKEPGVTIVDLTGDKPAYKFVKVALPKCTINLADKDHKTWPKAIDEAIAELKKQSKEISTLAD
jgi:hypothetical protein